MDHSIQRLLNDKLYDRRKQGALEYGNQCHDGQVMLTDGDGLKENAC